MDAISSDALTRVLIVIAERESLFTERFYEIFFARRPDTRELFGAYPLAEQEEMMRETLRSLLTLAEAANESSESSRPPENEKNDLGWLSVNLIALGESHLEYGVTPDMYVSYSHAMIECAREVVGDELDSTAEAALERAITRVCSMMNVSDT